MILWSISFLFALAGLALLLGEAYSKFRAVFEAHDRKSYRQVVSLLHDLQETLESGLVPSEQSWARVERLPAPWGGLILQSIGHLRASGSALLPTLKRIRALAQESDEFAQEAQTHVAQPLWQCLIGVFLIPAFGAFFYFFMPGVEKQLWLWVGVCLLAFCLSGFGALWVLQLSQNAQGGGLEDSKKHWVLNLCCAGEKILAYIQGGTPPDIAWAKTYEEVRRSDAEMALLWRAQIWDTKFELNSAYAKNAVVKSLVQSGESICKVIQVHLMEGNPCFERLESTLSSMRLDIRQAIFQQLKLLPTRALQPLFFCVAPSILGIVAAAFLMSALEALK